jgi:hypothetical protein
MRIVLALAALVLAASAVQAARVSQLPTRERCYPLMATPYNGEPICPEVCYPNNPPAGKQTC